MKICIDSDYKCHVSNDGTMREFEAAFFDDKCPEFIEGYRYIPVGEVWLSPDGMECSGMSPWKDYDLLCKVQLEHELALAQAELTDMGAALGILGVTDDEVA